MNSVTKVMGISAITNTFLSTLKIIIGLFCHSSALLADGVHSFSDLLTDFFAIIGNIMAKKPADEKHPYGHGKIEYLTSIAIGFIILILGFSIVHHSMYSTIIMSSILVSLISVITILVKYILSEYIINRGKKYKNNILIASGKESRADVISSLVVLASAILSIYSKYFAVLKYADKVAGIIVGILIIKTGYLILKENISIVIGEQEIDSEDYIQIKQILLKNKRVKTIDQLIILKYGYCYKVTIELSMDPKLTLQKCHDYVELIEAEIKKKSPRVKYINIHVNPYQELKNIELMDYENKYQSFIEKEISQNKHYIKKSKQKEYIKDLIDKHFEDIKIILKDNIEIGFLNYYKKNNCFILDFLYINNQYKNLKIEFNIIYKLLKTKKNNLCLLVHKKDIKTINLYRNLGFVVIDKLKNNYYMKYHSIS